MNPNENQQNVVFEQPQQTIPAEIQQPQQQPSPASQEGIAPPAQQNVPPSAGTTLPPPLPPPGSFLSTIPLWLKAVIGGISVILLIIIILLTFAHPKKAVEEKVTLHWWGLWEDVNVMQPIIDDFHAKHSNVTIIYEKEDPKSYNERLLTRIQNGTGPDIFRYHNSWIPEVLSVLAPLSTDAITLDTFNKSFYPVAQSDLEKNGAMYGIPLEIDTLSLFVNQSIFQAAGQKVPTAWDIFPDVARSLTVKDDTGRIKTAGVALGTYDNITHAPDILTLLFSQNGVNLNNIVSTAKNASDTLTFYTTFAKDRNNVWDATLDPSVVAFSKGNLAMFFGYSYDVFTIKQANPTLNFKIYPVPHLPNRLQTSASYWVEGVSIKSQHQKEAMMFMNYLSQKDTEQKLFTLQSKTRLFGEPYARVELASSLKDNPYLAPFVSQAKTAISSTFAGETYDTGINAQVNGYLGNAVRSIFVNTSTDTAIATLGQGISQVMSQYGK